MHFCGLGAARAACSSRMMCESVGIRSRRRSAFSRTDCSPGSPARRSSMSYTCGCEERERLSGRASPFQGRPVSFSHTKLVLLVSSPVSPPHKFRGSFRSPSTLKLTTPLKARFC